MYNPDVFKQSDLPKCIEFVREHSFAQLVSTVNGQLFCSHIPLMIDTQGKRLSGHIAKLNPQSVSLRKQQVLAVFQGAHGYVSPSWYQQPGVPTWNYQAVHIYGQVKLIEDEAGLKNLLQQHVDHYEAPMSQAWNPEYKEGLLQHIMGFEIEVTSIECKNKLSQNRTQGERQRAAAELEKMGQIQLSNAMLAELDN